MNIFRPYSAEPARDDKGLLTGIDRYQDVLGRYWKRFFLTGLVTLLGCLPLALGIAYVLFAPWSLFLLPLVGCWFILFVTLFLLYDKLDTAFLIEERIAEKYPEQAHPE